MAVDDSYTKALLHFNGSDTSTTFTDESGKIWTAGGTAQLDTAAKKFGTASLLLDGNSDYITTPDHADFNLGNGAFTVDLWARWNALPASGCNQALWGQFAAAAPDNNTCYFRLYNDGGTYKFQFRRYCSSPSVNKLFTYTPATLVINEWYHIAFVRNGNEFKTYLNGTAVGSTVTDTLTIPDLDGVFLLGRYNGATPEQYFNGWIDEFRFSKGIARWTADFTPPSEEYYNIEGSIIESAVVSDTMAGISPIEYTTESAEATDTFDGYSLSISTTESAEATDTFGNEITSYGPTTESAEVTDSMDALHLVDSITESAVVSGSMEAAEMIRKRVRFPNLQGKHLSLKFTSATDGSFAIYYLRHKMFKTRELCSDQKHPNTQGSHIGIKLSNSGTDDFTLMYVSQKMQLVTT